MSFSSGNCAVCREHKDFLMPLHGDQGGPMCCMMCCGKWHAEHGTRRKRGRIVIRAMMAFLDGGGRLDDIDKLKLTALTGQDYNLDPLGYLAGTSKSKDETIELTSELLHDTLKLVHPDMHPPERRELAHKVTQGLMALQPFVFPAPQPKPVAPKPQPRNGSAKAPDPDLKKAVTYPCPECADSAPYWYCTACRAEYDKRRAVEREREAKKQREWYARRKRRLAWQIPPTQCATCGTKFKGKRKDARFCSERCRQQAHRRKGQEGTRLPVPSSTPSAPSRPPR